MEELMNEIKKLIDLHGKVVAYEANAMSIWFETEDGKLYWVNIGECET